MHYLTGIIDGWQEGHEHGVSAIVFPKGIPDSEHYQQAVSLLSTEQLNVAGAGMHGDPMCVPEQIATGEVLNVVVKYIQSQIAKNPAMGVVLTARMVHPALKALFAVRMSKARRRDRLSVVRSPLAPSN